MKQKIYIILIFLISFGALLLQAQQDVEVNDVITGKIEVIATKSIRLTHGFHAMVGSNFHAHIDANAVDNTPTMTSQTVIGATNQASISTDKNHVRLITFREKHLSVPTGAYKHLEQIQYMDGLGRPVQNVFINATPGGDNIIQPIVYDDYGRETKRYLPYIASGEGGFIDEAEQACVSYYTSNSIEGKENDKSPFSITNFEKSFLNRVESQVGVGKDWHDNVNAKMNFVYTFNTNAIPSWDETGAGVSYPIKSLYITESIDENGSVSRAYKDKSGQVVIKESINGSEILKTYYIYDDFGQLRTIVPPLATSPADTELCYFYTYDNLNRLIRKKIPGAEAIHLVYDQRDRLVLSQDGNMRAENSGKYLFVKYDIFNRPVMTGTLVTTKTLTQIRDAFNDYKGTIYETYNASNECYGYSKNNSFPSGYDIEKNNVLTVTWYDNYNFITDLSMSDMAFSQHSSPNGQGYASAASTKTKGIATGTLVKALTVNNSGLNLPNLELIAVSYFDEYGNIIKAVSKNHQGGYDVLHNKFEDFTYQLLETIQEHKLNVSTIDLSITKEFKYDHTGRLLETLCQVNSEPKIVLNAYKYNELGELVSKGLHSEDVSNTDRAFVQKVDYKYNIRGWLTSINDPGLSQDGDLFGMRIYYNKLDGLNTDRVSGGAQFNGNIAAIVCGTAGDPIKNRGYGFSYDAINRLKIAKYGEGTSLASAHGKYSVTGDDGGIRYDKNGNIKQLQRFYKGSLADNLTYTYENNNKSNRLQKITDPVADIADMPDYAVRSTANYNYDSNGNMIYDPAKGGTVKYNILNLPESVDLGAQGKIYYHYDATGNKLAKYIENNSSSENASTEYIANLVYTNGQKSFFNTEEGRAIPIVNDGKTRWHFEYNLKDHLGNIRVTFGGSNIAGAADIVQTSSYYPFGMVMAQESFNSGGNSYQLNKYLYNGKELQANEFEGASLDWYDYGFRMYDASIGRWHCKDPLGESMNSTSPYSYCFNNPLSFVDNFGLYPRCIGNSTYYDEELDREVSAEEFMYWLNNGRYSDQPMVVQDKFWSNMVSNGDFSSYNITINQWSGWYRDDGSKNIVAADFSIQENYIHANSSGGTLTRDLTLIGLSIASEVTEVKSLGKYAQQSTNWLYANKFHGSVETGWTSANPNLLKVAKGAKWLGIAGSTAGIYFTGVNIYNEGWTLENNADLFFNGVAFIPGYGWAISSLYSGAKYMGNSNLEMVKKNPEDAIRRFDAMNMAFCFPQGSLVIMNDYSYKNIESVQVGDSVLTYNFTKEILESNPVLHVDSLVNQQFIRVVFNSGEEMVSTEDHPYYVQGKGWCSFNSELTHKDYGGKIGQLEVSDNCLIVENNRLRKVKVTQIVPFEKSIKTYNLTKIANSNNYFVNSVLVNNESGISTK